jgi:hypothetical protein
MVPQNSPVYKLITSETWNIVLQLTQDQYAKLTGKDSVRFTIEEDDFETTAPMKLFEKGTEYYATLTMDRLLTNYHQDRHLDILLHLEAENGYKIPLTSIVEKDFYLVPLKYFTVGADSGMEGLVKEVYSENGDVKLPFIQADKYNEDDTYGYVDTRLFSPGTWIRVMGSEERFQLNQTAKLTGVFNVNTGYAVFNRIEKLYENEAYCIVKKDTPYGISLYDHIALNGKTAVEQKIIY